METFLLGLDGNLTTDYVRGYITCIIYTIIGTKQTYNKWRRDSESNAWFKYVDCTEEEMIAIKEEIAKMFGGYIIL